MTRASKLVHPATLFIQSLDYSEVQFKDMTPLQQRAMFEYMFCEGDGVWGEFIDNLDDAVVHFGDVWFGVGTFANDAAFKLAMHSAYEDADPEAELTQWFNDTYICGARPTSEEQPPVIINNQDIAPEFGLIEWGFEWFNEYWAHRPEVQFVRFLPDWHIHDSTGRGGQ